MSGMGERLSTPWHLWVVGVVAALWNGFGCFDYFMTQTRREEWFAQMGMTAEQVVQGMRLDATALAGQAGGFVEGDHRLVLVDHPRTDGGDVFIGQGNGGAVGHRACIGERPTARQPLSAGRPSCPWSRRTR